MAPWIQRQLAYLMKQSGHAWLLQGASGLGQFELAYALARAWLCESPTTQGACGHCKSCHSLDVFTHPDFMALLPETVALERGWPLSETVQKELSDKKRKPSKDIRVEAARDMVVFSQRTASGAKGKVVLVYPAERMNTVTANALLKTLEEPPQDFRFVLATGAGDDLLPTIKSRCLSYRLEYPLHDEAIVWLQSQGLNPSDAEILLKASGARPYDALDWIHRGMSAQMWSQFPQAVLQADMSYFKLLTAPDLIDALQRLCHDLMSLAVGAAPRYFSPSHLESLTSSLKLHRLSAWSQQLLESAKTAEHPFKLDLMQETLISQAQKFLMIKNDR